MSERFQTKEQQVAEYLRENIVAGIFPRGQKLKQAVIAQRLQISITPVREALKILEAEGYILVTAHRGAVVAPLQLSSVEELYGLRLILEPWLTHAAALLITAADIEDLAAIDRMIVRSTDRKSLERSAPHCDFRFHFRLYQQANLPQALQLARVVWAKYPFDLLGEMPDRAEQATLDHERVLAALRARDGRKAARVMRAHIEAEQALLRDCAGSQFSQTGTGDRV